MNLREAWDAEAENWVWWARDRRDSYWRYHGPRFLELLPPPCSTLDVGCGEGRLPRDLKARGYRVTGLDGSATLIGHARAADLGGDYRVGDVAALPLADGAVELVTAFMVLHDTDDLTGAVREAARVLAPGGRLCLAIVHPINSAGTFEEPGPDGPFVLRRSYFAPHRFADRCERDGHAMTFHGLHRPLEAYVAALADAGLLVERMVEVPEPPPSRWERVPMFLDVRAVKPERARRPG
jgi:SAM-dependent methyltransferase